MRLPRLLLTLLVPAMAVPMPAAAQSADSIRACAAEVARTTGRTVSEFDATFQQRFLQTNVVRWPGIVCEVRDSAVWSLTVDGAVTVVGGWPSPEAKATFDQLDAETAEAIRTLDTRRQLLAQRLSEAEAQLRAPGADLVGATGYVRDGIAQALGR
jgi:hypothetical protein